HRLNVDPAIASGPLITTLNDILSLLIYFGIATAFLHTLM
ncbi:magnesium transporter, partial [Bacillus safensis]